MRVSDCRVKSVSPNGLIIRFNSVKARDHLLENGHVKTLRTWYSPRQMVALAISDGKPIGRVLISLIDVVPLDNEGQAKEVLAKYVNESGFNSVDEWIEEFRRLNRGRKVRNAYLYRVELIKAMRSDES